jgi:hypothetical protein
MSTPQTPKPSKHLQEYDIGSGGSDDDDKENIVANTKVVANTKKRKREEQKKRRDNQGKEKKQESTSKDTSARRTIRYTRRLLNCLLHKTLKLFLVNKCYLSIIHNTGLIKEKRKIYLHLINAYFCIILLMMSLLFFLF